MLWASIEYRKMRLIFCAIAVSVSDPVWTFAVNVDLNVSNQARKAS